jgi:hypothetical protein
MSIISRLTVLADHGDSVGYLIVVFCLALGVIIACRSAYRRTEVLLDDLEDE